MARTRKDAPAVQTYADHEVIVPSHTLSQAVTITDSDVGPDLEAVERAEAALAELSVEFPAWMRSECDRLAAARDQVKEVGFKKKERDELFRAAHDIKGEAATFGYPLAAEAADSLCRLIEHSPDPARIPMKLVDQHVDGVRAIIREEASSKDDPVGLAMVARLRLVTDEYLVEKNRHRPGYLDGIVALTPPLVPKD